MGLDMVELVMQIEDEFDISIDDALAPNLETPGQILHCVMELTAKSGRNLDTEEAWNKIVAIVSDELGVPKDVVTPDVHFVKDLGAD